MFAAAHVNLDAALRLRISWIYWGGMAKVLISVDDRLLQQIGRRARESGLSRSGYLAGLAERDVAHTSGRADASVRGALLRLDRLFRKAPAGDLTTILRAERDAR